MPQSVHLIQDVMIYNDPFGASLPLVKTVYLYQFSAWRIARSLKESLFFAPNRVAPEGSSRTPPSSPEHVYLASLPNNYDKTFKATRTETDGSFVLLTPLLKRRVSD